MLGKPTAITAALALAVFGLTSCADDTSSADEGSPRLSVMLTDAPGDVEAAWVQITEVRLQAEEGNDESGGRRNGDGRGDGDDGGASAAFPLEEDSQWHNLVALANGGGEQLTADLIQREEIPAGRYGQLRLMIGSAVLEADTRSASPQAPSVPDVFVKGAPDWEIIDGLDGTEDSGELKCPSCDNTGIKVNLPNGGLTLERGETGLVLDFDVSRSFGHQAGASGKWVMRPTITSSTLAVGSVEGTVTVDAEAGGAIQACGGKDAGNVSAFVPTATTGSGEDAVTKTAMVSGEGAYTVSYLSPGEWTMGFDEEVTFADEKLVFEDGDVEIGTASRTVEEGSTATVGYAITGTVECVSTSD